MDEFDPDLESYERRRPKQHGWVAWVGGIILVGAASAALWHFWDDLGELLVSATGRRADAGVVAVDAASPSLPSLAEGDELLRKMAGAQPSALLAGWLTVPNLVEHLTAAVSLVADGKTPRPALGFVELSGPFSVQERVDPPRGKAAKRRHKRRRARPVGEEHVFLAPASCARYDALVGVVTGFETARAVEIYTALQPYFAAALAEVGPGQKFEEVLTRALQRLVSVKLPEGEIELVPKGAVYAFKDPALESLAAPEKVLIRMGVRNATALQLALRRFAEGAGLQLSK